MKILSDALKVVLGAIFVAVGTVFFVSLAALPYILIALIFKWVFSW